MRNILTVSILALASLSGCSALDAMKASNQRLEQTSIDITYPTKAEYDQIIKRAEQESVDDPNLKGKSWLLVDTNEKNGKKYFVNTKYTIAKKNTATNTVKILNPDQSYEISYYKFFCYEGWGRKMFGDYYTADHRKKLSIPGFGPGESYDRRPYKSEEPIAKTICALGGFYRGSSDISE